MDRDPVAIPEGASIEQALDEYFLRYRSPWFPVVDAAQHFIGLVDRGAADNVPAVERASTAVSDVLARDSGALTVAGGRAARVGARQRVAAPARAR